MDPRIGEELEIVCPSPIDNLVLTQQPNHQSTDIWNGDDPGSLDCRGHSKEMAKISMLDNQSDFSLSLSQPLIGDTGLYHIKLRENTATEGCFKILKYIE
ncbi:hypothetical protein CMV_001819 [Castanea mollissima]|uniref:Uncharacterized protein n=1 Tax=Castanea mollissima TaxID=60419 RepID=A0A8J4VXM6_9ROSI|nr:hypothetical protein CMV_001819 [Castanea mollissima]